MSCGHGPNLKCIVCAPALWHPSAAETEKVNRFIYQSMVPRLIEWNRAYRAGDQENMATDYMYDCYWDSLAKAYPDHPFLKMVGDDPTIYDECLAYINKHKEGPKL